MNARTCFSALLISTLAVAPNAAHGAWTQIGYPVGAGPIVSDGAGGFIVANRNPSRHDGNATSVWSSGTAIQAPFASVATVDVAGALLMGASGIDILAGKVDATGSVQWGLGVVVCNATGNQTNVVICSDGVGGAILAWIDERVASGDVYVQRVSAAGAAQWTANGVPICTQAGAQRDLGIVSDGQGGAILVWIDGRLGVGNEDVYAQRVNAAGNPLWGADGLAVCEAGGAQTVPSIVTDGAGGAILCWWDPRDGDFDIFAQRFDASGNPLWAVDGVAVIDHAANQVRSAMVADGSQGAVITWEDDRSDAADVYAQRIDGTGTLLWTSTGAPVITEVQTQRDPAITTTDDGHFIVLWSDTRAQLGTYEQYVQKIDGNGSRTWFSHGIFVQSMPTTAPPSDRALLPDGAGGALVSRPTFTGGGSWSQSLVHRVLASGDVAWTIPYQIVWTGVVDEPADQGGWVQLRFARAPAEATQGILSYNVWRRLPDESATSTGVRLVRRGAAPLENESIDAVALRFPPGTWESLGSHMATQSLQYILAAPTRDDSTAAGPATEEFVVTSHASTFYVTSHPMSGRSVDNLPPLVPLNLTGTFVAPTTAELSWSMNGERDFVTYAVYKGDAPGFVPSAANRLGFTVAPEWSDPEFEPGTSHYKVSAFDRHGNESAFALVAPGQFTDVGEGIPSASFLGRPAPNPATGSATLRYGLARGGRVSIAVLDLRGRVVRRLVDRGMAAGTFRATWDGADEEGRQVAAGTYWIRFEAPGAAETRKLVRLR